jgi:hypothetical protein
MEPPFTLRSPRKGSASRDEGRDVAAAGMRPWPRPLSFESAKSGNSSPPEGVGMRKKTARTKAIPTQRDQAWFERKVAELKDSLEMLPADRREQLEREFEEQG